MTEDGLINASFLSKTLAICKPTLSQFIPIPEKDFRLSEKVDGLFDLIFPAGSKE